MDVYCIYEPHDLEKLVMSLYDKMKELTFPFGSFYYNIHVWNQCIQSGPVKVNLIMSFCCSKSFHAFSHYSVMAKVLKRGYGPLCDLTHFLPDPIHCLVCSSCPLC